MSKRYRTDLNAKLKRHLLTMAFRRKRNWNYWRAEKECRITRREIRQRRGSQYARDHAGEPGRNGGPKGQ